LVFLLLDKDALEANWSTTQVRLLLLFFKYSPQ